MKQNIFRIFKRAIIFLVIFSFIFSGWPALNIPEFNAPDAMAASQGDGVIFYGPSGNTTPQFRTYDGLTDSFSSASGTVAGTQAVIVKMKTSTTKDEYIAAYQDTTGNLKVMCYDGSSWSNEWSVAVAPSGTPTTRRFDIAYETTTGDVTVAYSRNTAATNALAYRTKSGSLSCGSGNWSGATNFPTTTSITTGTVQWVKADRDGRSGSDLDAFIWAGTNGDLGAAMWDGNAFTNFKLLETTLERVATVQDVDSFELAFESLSGNLMVVWGSGGTNGTNGAFYNRCVGGTASCTWTAARTAFPSLLDDATVLDLSANPLSNQMAFASIGNAGADLQAAYWSGTAWSGYPNIDTSCEAPLAGMRLTQTGWVTNNGITKWILTYDDSTGTGLSWFATTPGTALTTTAGKQTDWAATPAINDIRGRYDIDNNPFGGSQLMLTLSDNTNNIFAKALNMSAAGVLTWSNADGLGSIGTKQSHPQQGFHFQYKRFIPLSPILSVSATAGAKVTNLDSSATSQFINNTACTSESNCAAFKLSVINDATTVTSIKIAEIGTINAYSNLSNPTLIYDTDDNYANGTAGTFDTQANFAADQTVTFTNAGLTIPVNTSYYFYLRFDMKSGTPTYPNGGDGIDFQIVSDSDVAISSGTVFSPSMPSALSSAASTCANTAQTCTSPVITSYTNSTESALNYSAACTNCGARIGPGAPYRQTITISGYGFGNDPGSGSRDSASNKVEVVGAATTLLNDDASANTNVSSWSNSTIVMRTDSNIANNTDTNWGTNYGGASALKITAGGQAVNTKLNFYLHPQVTSITVPTAVANAAREYDAADSDGIITLNGTRFGSSATGGWVRILGCDSTTCSSPSGSAVTNSWSSSAIAVQVPAVIADNVYTGSVIMQQGNGSSNKSHTYTASGFRVLPRITSLSPSSGLTSSAMTVNGNHLCQNNGTCPSVFDTNNKVVFNNAISATIFTSWSNTAMTTAVPTGSTDGLLYLTSNTYLTNGKTFNVLLPTPYVASNMKQMDDAALTIPIAIGNTSSSTDLYLTMNMQADFSGGTLYPQIEYQPIGTSFLCTGTSTCASAAEGPGKAGPGPIDCSILANGCAVHIMPTDNVYHWQARVRHYKDGLSYYSAWTPFGGNGEAATDFKIDNVAPIITFPGANTCATAVSSLLTNSANITWSLNELANGQIEYSKNSNLTGSILYPPAPNPDAFSHSLLLNNLDSNTTYYFRVKSLDSASNVGRKPSVSPYCSFMTSNVTQPAKTTKFFVNSIGSTINGGSATSSVFSVYIPENSVAVKSAFLEIGGFSPSSGTNNISIAVNSQATSTYAVASNANSFKLLYKIDPANINFDPIDNNFSFGASLNTNINSAILSVTYSFAP